MCGRKTSVTMDWTLKRDQRSPKLISGPFLPLSHYSSNNTASGLSDPPPEPTSKPHNHPGVQRMPLKSCISSPSLLVINERFWQLLYEPLFVVFPLAHTYSTPRHTFVTVWASVPMCPHRHSRWSADEGRQGVHQSAACWAKATENPL